MNHTPQDMIAVLFVGILLGVALGVAASAFYKAAKGSFRKKDPSPAAPDPIPLKPPEPRRWVISGPQARELLALWTKWDKEDNRVARYDFWHQVEGIHPEIAEVTDSSGVHAEFDRATAVVIVEGPDDEED